MRKFAFVVAGAVLLSIALVGAGCKKSGAGGDAAGKTIKDKATGEDVGKALELPSGGPSAATKAPEAKAPAGDEGK